MLIAVINYHIIIIQNICNIEQCETLNRYYKQFKTYLNI